MSYDYQLLSKPDRNGQSKVITEYDRASGPSRLPLTNTKKFNLKDLHTAETQISEEVQSNFNKAKNIFVKGPISALNSIIETSFDSLKKIGLHIDNSDTPNAIRFKKYSMLAVSSGFILFAFTSLIRALKSIWSKDKSSKSLKFLDAFIKWTMGIGIGSAALGRGPFKIEGMKTILVGSGLTFLLSQLAGLDSGKTNLLGTLTKLTGTQDLLKGVISRSGLVPIPPGGIEKEGQ